MTTRCSTSQPNKFRSSNIWNYLISVDKFIFLISIWLFIFSTNTIDLHFKFLHWIIEWIIEWIWTLLLMECMCCARIPQCLWSDLSSRNTWYTNLTMNSILRMGMLGMGTGLRPIQRLPMAPSPLQWLNPSNWVNNLPMPLQSAILLIKRTYQPSTKRRKRKIGFMARNATHRGRKLLQRRRAKGRHVLC